MSSYVEGSLVAGEQVLYTGHISKWSVWGHMLLTALFLVAAAALIAIPIAGVIALLIAILLAVITYVKLHTTELAITNKRLVAKFGLISRSTVELNINKVESIQVHQTVWGRLFNYGSLVIAGGGNPQAPIDGISDPVGFRKAFMQAQDQAGQARIPAV